MRKLLNYIIYILCIAAVLLLIIISLNINMSYKNAAAISIFISIILVIIIKGILKYFGEIRYLKSPLSAIDKMSGEEFEEYLALRFKRRGYKVEMTPASNDYGADLICTDKTGTLVVQAKRYSANVGTAAVQEVAAAREYYEADRCMVVTNSFFTRNAVNLAEANGVELIDRNDLRSL